MPVILNLMCICFSILRDILKGIGYIRSGELGEKRVFKFSEREREKSRFRNSFKEKAEFDDRWMEKFFVFRSTGSVVLEIKSGSYLKCTFLMCVAKCPGPVLRIGVD